MNGIALLFLRWQLRLRRRLLIAGLAATALVAIVLAIPWLLTSTGLRDVVAGSIAERKAVTIQVDEARWGWSRMLVIDQLRITSLDESLHLNIPQVRAEQSLLQFLVNSPELGRLEIDQPQIELRLWKEARPEPETRPSSRSTLRAQVYGADVTVWLEEAEDPLIMLTGIDGRFRIERESDRRVLRVEPAVICDRLSLTPEFCDRGLHLIAPVLAEAAAVSGSITIELHDLRVPLEGRSPGNQLDEIELSGTIRLHEVSSRVVNPTLAAVTQSLSLLLKTPVPDTIRIIQDTEVEFAVRDGRVYHEGLAFVLPQLPAEVVLVSSGSVGVDNSLDLTIEVGIADERLSQVPIVGQLMKKPIAIQVVGTSQNPRVTLPEDRDLLDELADRLSPSGEQPGRKPSLARSIVDVIDAVSNEDQGEVLKTAPGSILNLIRAAREAGRKDEEPPKQEQKPD